jgi:ribonuclease-3
MASLELFIENSKLKIYNEHLLQRALTHRSYLNEHPEVLEDNERLEFLGDAILDFLVGAWLYNHFPEMSEGELTRMRSALVRTEQLAEFAKQINLGEVIYLGKGEEESGGRERTALLCAAFESVIGALYLDSSVQAVEDFVEPLLDKAAQQIIIGRRERDPKSIFQEWIQAQGFGTPAYRVISTTGPDHNKTFVIQLWVGDKMYGQGTGNSKRSATKSAAQAALNTLGLV